jgi:hypothetical protein
MKTQATSTFKIDTWDESPIEDKDGVKLGRTRLTKTFEGDLDGHSAVEMLAVGTLVETSRAYVALERIVCRLHGRSGSFVVLHSASGSSRGMSASWSVVPDSATGELRGLSGEAQITIAPDGDHTFSLDYEIDEASPQ